MATPGQEDRGRCASCGFLAFHGWGNPSEPRSVERGWRESGVLHGLALVCFRQAADLSDEANDASLAVPDEEGNAPSPTPAKILAVIWRDRNCPDWFRFQAGLTPKDHLERMNAIELEQQRQTLQVRLAEIERESRATQLQVADAIKASSEAIERTAVDTKSFTTKWTYVAVVLAGLAVIGTLAAAGIAALSYWFPHTVITP